MSDIGIELNTEKLDFLLRVCPKRTREIINKAAIDIQADAMQNTERVDTGAMMNGWAVRLTGGGRASGAGSDMAAVKARARALNPDAMIVTMPAPGEGHAVVGNVVNYAYYWEIGHHSFPPEHMLTRAVEKNRGPFLDAFNHLCDVEGA